jgi:hypothetical protein
MALIGGSIKSEVKAAPAQYRGLMIVGRAAPMTKGLQSRAGGGLICVLRS